MVLLKIIIIINLCLNVECLKILGIFSHTGKSHFYSFSRLLEALNDKGHSLTVLSYFPLKKERSGYKDIVFNKNIDLSEFMPLNVSKSFALPQFSDWHMVRSSTLQDCVRGLTSKDYIELLNSEEKFDLIIAEYFVWNCLLIPFADKLKVPIVGVIPNAMMPWTYKWFAAPNNPAYITPVISYGDCHKSFFKRTECMCKLLYSILYYEYVVQKDDEEYVRKYIGKDIEFDSILFNTSLLLVNSYFSLLEAKPIVPNVVEVGGIHIGQAQQLPLVRKSYY